MSWIILIVAGLFEVGFTSCLAKANLASGNMKLFWLGGFVVSLTCSMGLLYKAIQSLPIGTAYAVWTGIGAAGSTIIGMVFFNEPSDYWRIFFLMCLLMSIVGLKVVSPAS